MRRLSVALLAIPLGSAFGCSTSSDNSGHSAPTAGSSGLAGGAMNAAGAVGQSGSDTASGGAEMTSGGGGNGGYPSGGNVGISGASGAGAGTGGRSNGGAAGANAGSAGAGVCVQNLGCKLSAPPSTGDIHQDCVDRINQFLTQCACLPALTRRKDGEACADQMAEYDATMNSAHAGAIAQICQPGGSQNECPGYSSNTQVIGLCMQQMWDEGPPPTDPCTDSCYETHGHFINMTDKDVTQVACGFYTTAQGKVWATQNFSR